MSTLAKQAARLLLDAESHLQYEHFKLSRMQTADIDTRTNQLESVVKAFAVTEEAKKTLREVVADD